MALSHTCVSVGIVFVLSSRIVCNNTRPHSNSLIHTSFLSFLFILSFLLSISIVFLFDKRLIYGSILKQISSNIIEEKGNNKANEEKVLTSFICGARARTQHTIAFLMYSSCCVCLAHC